jgi:AcrR family transcriptional regulator
VTEKQLKWTRRKDERPAEILNAAMDVFVEQGFADAKLTEIARRAGIVKGTLYRYFDTKEDLFRAVVHQALSVHLHGLEQMGKTFDGELSGLISTLLMQAASRMADRQLPAILRMVISESRAFPDLATIWHDEVLARVLNVLAGIIEQEQAKGTVRPGDPKLYAFSIIGPMVAANLFHEVFGSASPYAPDLQALAKQHCETVLNGLKLRTD